MTKASRRWLLGAGLLATLGLVLWLPPAERPLPEAPRSRPTRVAAAAPAPAALPDSLTRTPLATAPPDAFAPRSWRPPPPPPVATKPAPPTAPPLPFAYLGRLVEGPVTTVFLTRGAQHLAIKAGEQIDAQYRLEAASEEAVTFTYLPLAQTQALSLSRPH